MENKLIKRNTIISLLFFILVVIINVMGAKGLINNMSQKAVSKAFPTMITPAGYAFAIWGVIYSLIFIALISILFKPDNKVNQEIIKNTSMLFWLSSTLNILWTIVFSYKIIWLSMIFIIGMLVCLFNILKKLKMIDRAYKTFYDIAFGLYTGWIFVASFVNISAFLVSIQFVFFGRPSLFYNIFLVIIIAFAWLSYKDHENPVFYVSVFWAFMAIIKARAFESSSNPMFMILAIGVILSTLLALNGFKQTKYKFF